MEFNETKLSLLAELFNLETEEVTLEYYSDKIAHDLVMNNDIDEILSLAKKKIDYLRQKRTIQSKLNI